MSGAKWPKAGEWRASALHRYAVVSDRRIAYSTAVSDPAYYGGHLVADVSSVAHVPLIAATPDLAEACRMLVESYVAIGAYDLERLSHAREAARGALAKARGETP